MHEKPQLVRDDPWLEPYANEIEARKNRFHERLSEIVKSAGSLEKFASAHNYLGISFDKGKNGWWYREWAPAAKQLSLIGEFNNWDRHTHVLKKLDSGVWEIFITEEELKDKSLIKVHVQSDKGERDRIPAYIYRVVQNEETHDFDGQVWDLSKPFKWSDKNFNLKAINENPFIYEAHVGLAQEEERVGTYKEFTANVLPRIKKLGYNVIQLMAIQEHPYYGSFGYHVSSFYAASSRFGTPEDLKELINEAHNQGIAVIIDIVHSHAVKNLSEGLNEFDGSDDQYFHPGGRGNQETWDSKLFNYGKWEVLQFLLSNIKFWVDEFHVDGFRFDGITSMMYMHHGDFTQFDHYDKYFVHGVDWDALIYLQLANQLLHDIKPDALSIAEDMSGMPGLCRTIEDGGIGFDFRLGMGIPDFWIKYLKEKSDESWSIHELWSVMTNRRWKERTVAYAESHDQAIVGDKTVAFWLMDKEMYYHMQVNDENLEIERGLALHKMIRLFTASLGGEAYLNFIGNEFGHPEWVDFPREGNNWSFHYTRRQWSLADDENLKYKYLNTFDHDMIHLLKESKVLPSLQARQLNMDDVNNVIVFERNNLIFAYNFNAQRSIPDYKFQVPEAGAYQVMLCSDNKNYGGHGRVDTSIKYDTSEDNILSVYLPNRTAVIWKKS